MIGLEPRKCIKSHLTQFHLPPLLFLFLLRSQKPMTSTQKPHFFRIIHPSFLTHGYPVSIPLSCLLLIYSFVLVYMVLQCEFVNKISQGIPQTFLREYGNSLSHFVFLHLPTGAEWRVELLKLHGEVLFSTGWQQFVEHYSIEYGYFLLSIKIFLQFIL